MKLILATNIKIGDIVKKNGFTYRVCTNPVPFKETQVCYYGEVIKYTSNKSFVSPEQIRQRNIKHKGEIHCFFNRNISKVKVYQIKNETKSI